MASRSPPSLAELRRSLLYSEEFGIRLPQKDDREYFKWFLASLLFGGRAAAARALQKALDLDLALIEHAYESEHTRHRQQAERLAAIGQVASGVARDPSRSRRPNGGTST
jgi:hypothetical protein